MTLSLITYDNRSAALEGAEMQGFTPDSVKVRRHGDFWQWHLAQDPRFEVALEVAADVSTQIADDAEDMA